MGQDVARDCRRRVLRLVQDDHVAGRRTGDAGDAAVLTVRDQRRVPFSLKVSGEPVVVDAERKDRHCDTRQSCVELQVIPRVPREQRG